MNSYNNTLLNYVDSYISPDSSEESKKQMQILNNDMNSIILYLNSNLLMKDHEEIEEEIEVDMYVTSTPKPIIEKVDTNNYLKSILKNNLKFTIEQLNHYYYKKYLSSELSFDSLIDNFTLLTECLTDLLCKVSKNN